jgi:pyruvate,water dikinase
MYNPEKSRAEFDSLIEHELSKMNISATRDMLNRLAQRIEFMETRSSAAFPVLLPRFIPMLAPSIILLNALTELAAQTSEGEHGFSPLALEVTRGIPNNVTTQMDLSLWDTARLLQADEPSLDMFNA